MPAARPYTDAGFTLIEMLAVLFIIAMMTGLVVVNMPRTTDAGEDTVRALALDLNRSARQSLYDGKSRALAVSQDRWELQRFDAGEWAVESTGELAGRVTLEVEGAPTELTEDLQPLILFEPSGIATPFALEAGERRERFTLVGATDGEIDVVSGRAR